MVQEGACMSQADVVGEEVSPKPVKGDSETPNIQNPEQDHNTQSQWSNPTEFLLSCVAMSVGLGNVWRFPFVAYENGGGAFLIPYLCVLVFIGRPMYFLELSMGQFSGKSAAKVWDMVPIARGVGYGQCITCFYIATYYCSIIALAIHYFFASFSTTLPWTESIRSASLDQLLFNKNASIDDLNAEHRPSEHVVEHANMTSLAEMYFLHNVIKSKDKIDDGIGLPDLELLGCLFLCYLLLFLTMWKGVKSSGKVISIHIVYGLSSKGPFNKPMFTLISMSINIFDYRLLTSQHFSHT